MKTIGVHTMLAIASRRLRRNVLFLVKFLGFLAVLSAVYALLFDLFMALEGREFSFISGLYWSLSTMTTLGYGDITFTSDTGRLFSVVVLLSGMLFMLVLLPFIIIEFVYTPIIQAQEASRTPRELPSSTAGHVLLTSYDALAQALITRLVQHGTPYWLIVPDIKEALSLHDLGLRVLVGEVDDLETYRKARTERAALVAVTAENDPLNTNIVFTVRQCCAKVPIVATAQQSDSTEVLEVAGATQVLLMSELIGHGLARCSSGGGPRAHVLGQLGGVLMAEARAQGTPWVGRTLAEAAFGERLGFNVAGLWERGKFELAGPRSTISEHSVLFMALSPEQLERYNQQVGKSHHAQGAVVVVGGGVVGQAAVRALQERNIPYCIVERTEASPDQEGLRFIQGNAADLRVLRKAGLDQAPAVIITTHDDDTNIYLTIRIRRVRPDVRIISRATHERNVGTLHRAGADFVLSNASLGASAIFNHLRYGTMFMLVEGLFAKRLPVPPGLQGKTLSETQVRSRTGCSVVALEHAGQVIVNPPPTQPLPADGHLVLIVTPETEQRLLTEFGRA